MRYVKLGLKGVTAFVFGLLLGFVLTFGVPVHAGDGMVTFSTGQKLPAASLNLIVTAFRTGRFYDSAGAGSNYLGVSHNGTDAVLTTNTGKVRISSPTGSTVDLEVNGTDVLAIGSAGITASQYIAGAGNLGITGSAEIDGTLKADGIFTLAGAATLSSTLTASGAIGTTSTGHFGGAFHATGAGTFGSTLGVTGAGTFASTLGVTGVTTLTGALTASSTTPSALNYGVQLSTSANHNSALDSYFQTSWTPSYSGTSTAGAGTYSTQVGTYTRIGNVVHLTYNITTTAHTGTGNMALNIPVTANTTTGVQQVCPPPEFQNVTLPAGQVMGSMLIDPSFNNVAQLRSCPNASGGSCAAVAIDTAMTIKGSCTIITNDL